MIILNKAFFGSLVNYLGDNCIIVFINTALYTNLFWSIYALYIEKIPNVAYFNNFKSKIRTNSSYLFFKDRFLFLSKNNRFLVWRLLLSSGWDSAPLPPRAALLSEDQVIWLLNQKFQWTRDFIKENIYLSEENIKALDQILDLTISSNTPEKYSLVFGKKITRTVPQKVLKHTFCTKNEVYLFEKLKEEFLFKDNVVKHIRSKHVQGENSIYVYGRPYLFKVDKKISILTQNKILYVFHRGKYEPYDPTVDSFAEKTLYIKTKTLNPEYIELDMKTPKPALRSLNLNVGKTSELVFFITRNNVCSEKKSGCLKGVFWIPYLWA